MGKRISYVQDLKYLKNVDELRKQEFSNHYYQYVKDFSQYGILLTIQPCYYYNGKYHTQKRNSGCFLAFRIRLYPEGMSFAQAKNCFLCKEFFSHKIVEIKKGKTGYCLKEFQTEDRATEHFIEQILNKASQLYIQEKDTLQAVRENPYDFLRSWIYIYRYRAERKHTLWGYNIEWLGLFIVILLICLSVYLRLKRIHYGH